MQAKVINPQLLEPHQGLEWKHKQVFPSGIGRPRKAQTQLQMMWELLSKWNILEPLNSLFLAHWTPAHCKFQISPKNHSKWWRYYKRIFFIWKKNVFVFFSLKLSIFVSIYIIEIWLIWVERCEPIFFNQTWWPI